MHDLPMSATLLAALAPCARGRARARAIFACHPTADVDLFRGALGNLGQRQLDVGFDVRPAHGSTRAATTEHVTENVAESGENIAYVREPAAAHATRAIVAKPVVERPLFRIRENLIGLRSVLETRLGFLVTRIAVRVKLEGKLAVGALQLSRVGIATNTQNFIKVSLFTHGINPLGYSKLSQLPPCLTVLAGDISILNTACVSANLPDDPRPWECLDQSYLFRRPPWLVLRHQRFRLPSGREIADYWISEYPPWVNVVAITADDDVVLLRQYRPGIGDVHYEIPAGVVEDGEAIEDAARRELREETGYGGGRWRILSQLSANPALQNNITTTFLAEDVTSLGQSTPELTEDLRVHLVKPARILDLFDKGEMIQALHAAPLLRYLLSRQDR